MKSALQARIAVLEAVEDEFFAAGLEMTPQTMALIESILKTCFEEAEKRKMSELHKRGGKHA